ncbi:MAG TPA: carboxypeptidase-like regulatory domain-containing protein [Gemmataceae bacterium]|nr:carboxypeptidase-like regulatory domain-containing protein [Gemmataceae bacterium]
MKRLLPVLPLLLLAGCDTGPYKIAPVSGRVTLNGKPLANVAVTFQPIAPEGSIDAGPGSSGVTDADGRYTLTLIGKDRKGAVVGKHKVRITYVPDAGAEDDAPRRFKQLPAKYNSRTTLECEVPPGGKKDADFALASP